MSIQTSDLHSKETILANMERMNALGCRFTGNKAHAEFIGWLKDEIKGMDYEVVSTPYKFTRWEAKDVTLTVGGENIAVSSPFPYSGATGEEGVTGKLYEVCNNVFGYVRAAGNIAVVHIRNLRKISSKIAFDKRKSVPADLEIEPSYRGPVSTSFVKTLLYNLIKPCGTKAVVCVWEDMSDVMVAGHYLNFILPYLKVPVIWVNETEGKKVLAACKKHETATVRMIADIEKNAATESFYAVCKGTDDTKEAIIVNTHTDGNNCVEENGPIALLSLMKYFKQHPTKHTLIFVFITGHLHLANFKTGADQATSRWLADNRPMWNGKTFKAYAGVSVEHLGCTEWKDKDGVYQKTNDIDVELVYTGNKKMDDIYYEAVKDRKLLRTMTLRGHNFLHFGEGQPLFNKHIPEIALVTAPDYLTAVDETTQHMEKFNLDLMCEQIETFVNCITLLDKESADTIGKAQFYSLGVGKLK